MPKKVVEPEQEIDLSAKAPVKVPYYAIWFKETAVNNPRELRYVVENVAQSALDQFGLAQRSKAKFPEIFGAVFYGTFETILAVLRERQKMFDKFGIQIAQSVIIGYTNNDDEDNEKTGNFQPVMKYVGINRDIVDNSSSNSDKMANNWMRWMDLNVKNAEVAGFNKKSSVEYYTDIQSKALDNILKNFGIGLENGQMIIPLFCLFMDSVTEVLRQMYAERVDSGVTQVSMNVLGLFDEWYSVDEDGNEVIEFEPNITMKLGLKNDSIATREGN